MRLSSTSNLKELCNTLTIKVIGKDKILLLPIILSTLLNADLDTKKLNYSHTEMNTTLFSKANIVKIIISILNSQFL